MSFRAPVPKPEETSNHELSEDQPAPLATGSRWRRSLGPLRRRLALVEGTDVPGTMRRITDHVRITGEAPWMMVCSCLLASIGLDVNSTAVIIGAMLISPLMSPILGIGLGTGIADRKLLLASARELALATLVSLATSAVYFKLSPLAVPTTELIARTTPTLLDVGVAFFGGVAGIVAGSRRETSLALPGVAIATALMPPICTAGFGLATGRPEFFFGALYLFALNALFIALATFLVVRFLKFPLHTFASGEARQRELRQIGTVATLAVLPSLWFLYTTVQRQRERGRIEDFIERSIRRRHHDVLRWELQAEADSSVVKVFIAGAPLDSATRDSLFVEQRASGLSHLRMQPVQSDVSSRDLSRMQTELQSGFLQAIASAQAVRDSVTLAASRRVLEVANRHPAFDSARVSRVAADLRTTFPEIRSITWMRGTAMTAADTVLPRPTVQLHFAATVSRSTRREIVRRAQQLVWARLAPDSALVEQR